MANKSSKACSFLPAFDRLMQNKYFKWDYGFVQAARMALANDQNYDQEKVNQSIKERVIEILKEKEGSEESIKYFEDNYTDWLSYAMMINQELNKEKENSQIDTTQEAFLQAYAERIIKNTNESKAKDELRKRSTTEVKNGADVYKNFKTFFSGRRYEILDDLIFRVIQIIDRQQEKDEYRDYNTLEIINQIGVVNLMDMLRENLQKSSRKINETIEKRQKELKTKETEISTQEDKEELDELSRDLSKYKEAAEIYDILTSNEDAWLSAIYMVRHMLFEACGIKLDGEIAFEDEYEDYQGDPDEKIDNAEESSPDRENWMIRTNTLSSFLTLSFTARSVLYRLHETSDTNIFGRLKLIDIMKTHQTLMGWRSKYGVQNSEDFINMLEAEGNEMYEKLYNESEYEIEYDDVWPISLKNIIKDNPYLRTAIFNAYRKNGQNYVYHNYVTSRGRTVVYRNTDGINSSILLKETLGSLHKIQDSRKCIFDSNGILDNDKVNNFIRGFKDYDVDSLENWYSNWMGNGSESEDECRNQYIKEINSLLNLQLAPEDIDALMSDKSSFSNFIKQIQDLCKIFEDFSRANALKDNIEIISLIENDNKVRAIMTKIIANSKTQLRESKETVTERCVRYNNSTYYYHTIPCALGDLIEKIIYNKNRGTLKRFLEEEFLNSSIYAKYNPSTKTYEVLNPWLKELYEHADDAESPFVEEFLNGMLRGLGNNSRDAENFKEKDFNKFYIAEALHSLIKSDFKMSAVPLFTTGDSNSTRLLPTPWFGTNENELLNELVNIAFREFKRMDSFNRFIEYCESKRIKVPETIKVNANKFTLLPYLNKYYNELKELYSPSDTKGENYIQKLNDRLKDIIREHINEEYDKFVTELKRQGLVVNRNNGYVLNISELAMLDLNPEDKSGPYQNQKFLKAYFMNSQIGMAAQLELLTVSPAFYNGSDDMQKRFKELIASGTPLDSTALDPTTKSRIDDGEFSQNVVYVNDIFSDMSGSEFMSAVEDHIQDGYNQKAIAKFKHNTVTDGQAFRSFESYRKIMIMSGERWTESMEAVYQIIMNHRKNNPGQPLSKEEWTQILSYNVSFQPLKPFYYGFEKVNMSSKPNTMDYFPIPVQIKYSEIPLIPELMPMYNDASKKQVNKLYALAQAIDDKKIDLVAFNSTVKVGGWNSVEIKDCQSADDFKKEFEGNPNNVPVHKLSLSGLRLQQNVPYKVDVTRGAGTQIKKNGYGDLAESKGKVYPSLERAFGNHRIKIGKETSGIRGTDKVNGRFFAKLYSAAGATGYIRSFLQVFKTLNSPEKVSERLTNQALNNQRQSNDTVLGYQINEDGSFQLPLSEGTNASDNIAVLLSILRNDIIKQKMKGGSAVQVSPFGFEDVLKVKVVTGKDGKKNILCADCARTFDFSYTDSHGNKVKLDYLTYVDPMTGMPLDENGKPVEPEEPTGKPGQEYYGWNTKLGKDFPGIFDLISYRIPTEEFYSAINLRIKRFFPPTMGGIIMVPTQFTTIAGFDFDIDKLYYLTREYRMKRKPRRPKSKNARNKQIWNIIYGLGKDEYGKPREKTEIYKELVKARDRWIKERDDHATPKEAAEGAVVAQSSDYSSNRMIDYDVEGKLYALFSEKLFSEEEEDEDESDDIQDEEQEQEEEIKKENNEHEFLYSFWEEAGLEEKYGSREDYVRRFITEHPLLFSSGWETIDPNKSFLENSQCAINNLIFDMYKDRLESEDTFVKRYTIAEPLDVQQAKRIMIALTHLDSEQLKAIRKEINEITTDENSTMTEQIMEILERKANEYHAAHQEETNPINVSTTIKYQTSNSIYDKLIGISANQNINQRLLALVYRAESKVTLRVGGMFDRAAKTGDRNVGKNIKERTIGGIDTESQVRQGLGVSVDGVKNHDFEGLNIDDNNYNLACFLLKIGASYFDLGLLFNQPVVVIAQKKMADNIYLNISDAIEEAMIQIAGNRNTYYNIKNNMSLRDENTDTVTRDEQLALNIKQLLLNFLAWNNENGEYGSLDDTSSAYSKQSFIQRQIYVAHFIQMAQNAASKLSDAIGITKSTSLNSVQSRSGDIEELLQKCFVVINSLERKDSPIIIKMEADVDDSGNKRKMIDPTKLLTEDNGEEILDFCSQNSMGMEQAAFTAIYSFVYNILSLYFPYYNEGFRSVKGILEGMSKKEFLNGDIYEDINKFMSAYMSSRMCSILNPEANVVIPNGDGFEVSKYSNLLWYKIAFAECFARAKEANEKAVKAGTAKEDWSKYAIIECIKPSAPLNKSNVARKELRFEQKAGLHKNARNILTESWEAALNSEDEELRRYAYGLLLYSFYNSGFKKGKTSVFDLAPVSAKRSLTDGKTSYVDIFNEMFNLYENNGLIEESIIDAPLANENQSPQTKVSVPIIEIVKSFLLNTIDAYSQFRKKVSKSNSSDSLYSKITELARNNGFSRFTVTLGSDSNHAVFGSLVLSSETIGNDRRKTVFYPCIQIDIENNGKTETAIYIADVNSPDFDYATGSPQLDFTTVTTGKTQSPSITYYRMDPALGGRIADTSTPTLYGQRKSVDQKLKSDPRFKQLIDELGEMPKAADGTQKDGPEPGNADLPNKLGEELKEIYSEINFDLLDSFDKLVLFDYNNAGIQLEALKDNSGKNIGIYKFVSFAYKEINEPCTELIIKIFNSVKGILRDAEEKSTPFTKQEENIFKTIQNLKYINKDLNIKYSFTKEGMSQDYWAPPVINRSNIAHNKNVLRYLKSSEAAQKLIKKYNLDVYLEALEIKLDMADQLAASGMYGKVEDSLYSLISEAQKRREETVNKAKQMTEELNQETEEQNLCGE